jgi:hypothetical protein
MMQIFQLSGINSSWPPIVEGFCINYKNRRRKAKVIKKKKNCGSALEAYVHRPPFAIALRALLAASLHGFSSLHFRENFKKVKKSILQQLPFPYMFPMIATVLPNALGSTVHFPFNCLF